jgi:hypothetical protein
MKLLWYLLLILALYYIYISLRFAIKRILLLHKIKRFAKENRIDYKFSTSAFFVPSNRHGTAVILKTNNAIYNIRLFGLLRKNCAVHFWSKEQYITNFSN